MAVIRIQEHTPGEQHTIATVSFDYGIQYTIQIRDPFADTPEQEKDLEWYFEEYLTFPFTQDVRAKKAAASICTYGESLFTQVFADPGALAAYKQARQQGLHTLQIEIAGSSAFHRLHWEALYDSEIDEYLSLHASVVRQNITPQTTPATMQSATTINVLVVVARPGGSHDVGYRTISRPLMDELEKTKLPVEVTLLRPGTYQALVTHLEQATRAYGIGHYHIVHFDVHGALLDHAQLEHGAETNRYLYMGRFGRPALEAYDGEKAFLFLEGEQDERADPVEAGELAKLLRRHQIPMVLLNACQSGKLSGEMETSLGNQLIQAGVQAVVAMGYSVTVSAAEMLMPSLYQALFQEKQLSGALSLARQTLANRKERRAYYNQVIELEDWLLPILYQNQAVQFALESFTPQEEATFFEVRAAQYRPPQLPSYGFVGRDLDILQIEKRLLLKRNLLLIRGMGGAGKTTLSHHLAGWWQRTGLVQDVFYFGYDERAWNRQQIMQSIARKLLDKYEMLTFQSLSLDAQQARLTQLLKSTRYLLILDNLESITGSKLAVQHTLPRKEQEALRLLLADLVGGQTLALLGSRSAEEWLAKGTFEENRYELAGLDQEAASQLAERVLERHSATKYRSDPDLPKLLKLLDGFPLALEVVLANLAHQTPTEVMAALQKGNADLQVGTSEKRTENILRCVEYSYRNLSPATQQLLLCLAPFTSVIWRDMLDRYAEQLKQQSALASLPFEKWIDVVRETEKWGLLSSDPDVPSFLHIQPVLPYFLRHRLESQEELQGLYVAIDNAFYQHYLELSNFFFSLLSSKQAQELQLGLLLTHYEYENVLISLQMALREKTSILPLYGTLNSYLEHHQDYQRGRELDRLLLTTLEALPLEEMASTRQLEWIGVLNAAATRQSKSKQHEVAKASYLEALTLLESVSIDEKQRRLLQAVIYHNLGNVAQEQRQWVQAEQYYQQALQIYIEFQDRHSQAGTYHQLGVVAQEQRQWVQAEQYYQQALQIYIEFQDRHSQASTYHNLGLVAQEQRQWAQAEQYYQQTLQIDIEFQDRHSQASTYHNLGRVAQEQRQWAQTEQYYQQALQIYIEFQDRYEQAGTYHQLGVVAQDQRQWAQAEQYYQQALQIYIEFQDRHSQARTYHQLGVVAQDQRQWVQAEQYYQQALQIKIEFQDRYAQANTYHNLGRVAQEQRQWVQAERHFLEALRIFVEYPDTGSAGVVLRSLARLWLERKDPDLLKQVASLLESRPEEIEVLFQKATQPPSSA